MVWRSRDNVDWYEISSQILDSRQVEGHNSRLSPLSVSWILISTLSLCSPSLYHADILAFAVNWVMQEDDTARTNLCLNTRMRFYLLLLYIFCLAVLLHFPKSNFHNSTCVWRYESFGPIINTEAWKPEKHQEQLDDFQSNINILLHHLQIKNNREHVCTHANRRFRNTVVSLVIFGLWYVAFTQTWFHIGMHPCFLDISIPVTSLDLSVWVGYVWIRFHTLFHTLL